MTTCADCDGRGWNLRDARIQPCHCGTYEPPKWVLRGDAACLLPHHKDPDRPRRAHLGYTCAGHHAGVERLIAELPALHEALGLMLTASEKPAGDGGKTRHGMVAGGVNLNRNVVDARDEIHAECVRLVRHVAEETGDAMPTRDTVPALAAWLVDQVDWICSQLDVDDTYRWLVALTRNAKRLAYPNGRRRLEIGPCGDGDCPGRLWLTGDTDEARTMACDDCRRVVEPRYWRRERRRIDGVDVNPWLTCSEAAVQYGTTTRTVERWVAKGRLKARGVPMRVKASAVEEIMRMFVGKEAS